MSLNYIWHYFEFSHIYFQINFQMLDENNKFIQTIVDYQGEGKMNEALQFVALFYRKISVEFVTLYQVIFLDNTAENTYQFL